MALNYPWYEVITGSGLLQGDILYKCPVLVPASQVPNAPEGTEHLLEYAIAELDVVVMSQSCDLEQKKLDLVLVCPHWSISEFGDQQNYFRSSRGKEELKRGGAPGYHLLNRCDIDGWVQEARVVDFRNVYSLPFTFLEQYAEQHKERLRLLPPYREHLSQAFARFFMRVGLPIQADLS